MDPLLFPLLLTTVAYLSLALDLLLGAYSSLFVFSHILPHRTPWPFAFTMSYISLFPRLVSLNLQLFSLLEVGIKIFFISIADSNDTTTAPPSRLTESERLAAIIVPSVVGGLIVIAIIIFLVMKIKERRQTEGTYRPSSEEQQGSRMPPNSALKLPPEERLI
ncbi:protein crumbs homolog 3 [Gastrophryne carolinensis]